MRVLYLAPSSRHPEMLSRRSFLDEEIRALAAAGVDAYVVSDRVDADSDDGRIHVRAVAPASRRQALAFLARCAQAVPLRSLAGPARCVRAAAIEARASEVIGTERIEVVHSYFGWPRGFGGLLAKTATGVPLAASLRGCDVNVVPALGYGLRLDPAFDRALRRLLRAADTTLSVSEFLRREAIALGASAPRARVVLKGVRTDLFALGEDRHGARARLGLPPQPVVLVVSGLVAIKGLPQVLRAAALLRTSHAFSLVVCGDGPLEPELRQLAAALGIADRTRFAGKVPRDVIATYFQAADLFVQGSVVEASGNAILEAMASALPVVCTDAGGPREYVRDGLTGFVVPVGDANAMAARVRCLLDRPALGRLLGDQGRQRAEAAFGYDRMIRDTLDIYGRLIDRRGAATVPVPRRPAGAR